MVFFSTTAISEPWIPTSDLKLRSDIETLSDIGVIKVPITTYPLMWAGIIKDIEQAGIESVPFAFKDVYWRVKRAGRNALSGREKKLLKASASTSEQVFRSFGDSNRGAAELNASYSNTSKVFAWNVQVNRLVDPMDNDLVNYDGSYLAAVWGNWIFSVGSIEKWWGPSWDSANLLSNNARAPIGFQLNRNYSDESELPVLGYLGQWSFSAFTAKLDDDRVIDKPYLSGGSVSLKPIDSFEVSYRATVLSSGTTNQITTNQITDNFDPKTSTQVDLRWSLPKVGFLQDYPTNVYFSVTDEGYDQNYSTLLYGLSSHFSVLESDWRFVLESSETYGVKNGSNNYNQTYDDGVYRTGYRYNRRAIGSTYDNDSKVISLGLLGEITGSLSFSVKIQDLSINEGNGSNVFDTRNTVTNQTVETKRIITNWSYQLDKETMFDLEFQYTNEVVDSFERQQEKYRVALSWSYYL